MSTIWKYPLEITTKQVLDLPYGGRILCVQTQNNIPCLWIEHGSEITEKRTIITVGTGHEFDSTYLKYIGTYQLDNGYLVFHVYEKI